MEIEVRRFDGDARTFFEAGELAFGERPRDEDHAHWAALFEADRAVAAFDGPRIVGTAAAFSYRLTVPGATLPAAGVTIVGVHPTHRRQGILRRMMRLQLDEVHERGEPIAILWASEGSIYQRFGYALGSMTMRVRIERDRSAFRAAHAPSGTVRFVDPDEARALFPPIYEAVRPTRAGFFDRSAAYWEHDVLPDPEHRRGGLSQAFHVVHEVDGTADGYVRYRIRDAWEHTPRSSVVVVEKMATSPAADLDLWRYLLGIDLMATLDAWNVAPDDPIVLSVLEPRRLDMGIGDGLWIRLVDVGAALAGRGYAGDGRLVVEVGDEFCAWNAGRYDLRVEAGAASVARTTDPPDLACDVTDLGAAYLGTFTFAQLAAAARMRELRPGAVARADALFRTDRAPWCPRVF